MDEKESPRVPVTRWSQLIVSLRRGILDVRGSDLLIYQHIGRVLPHRINPGHAIPSHAPSRRVVERRPIRHVVTRGGHPQDPTIGQLAAGSSGTSFTRAEVQMRELVQA